MTLNDIRKKSGLLIVVIGVAMLGFILTDLMSSGTSLFQQGQNLLLKVDNKEVTYTNFERDLEESIRIKFLSNFGTVNVTDQQRNTERDLLWDQQLNDILFSEKYSQSGIIVNKTETWDLISGEINGGQAPLFGYFFREQTESGDWNQYTPDLIRDWIEIGQDNPQWPRYIYFKNNTVRERGLTKYYNAVKKGLYATQNDGKDYYYNQTKSVSGEYLYIDCNIPTKEDEVTEKEIRKYYNSHKSNFLNNPNREISYFIFDLAPSDEDRKNILDQMNELLVDRKLFNKRLQKEELELGFMNTNNLEGFINQYGDNKYEINMFSSEEFYKKHDSKKIADNIIKPYFEKDVCKIGKIINSTKDSVQVVYLERDLYASDQTLNEIYSIVFDFINENKKIENLDEVAKKINKQPRKVTLEKMDESVPGLGSNRQIVRWAFNDETIVNEPNFFDLQDKYVVALVTGVFENEHKTISESFDEIKLLLEKKKMANRIIKEISDIGYDNLEDLALSLKIELKKINQLRINSDNFGDQGYNPEAVGAFFSVNVGELSSPYFYNNGVYVFHKTNESKINYPSNFNRYQGLIEKKYQSDVDLLLVDILKKDKKIIDNRFNFY